MKLLTNHSNKYIVYGIDEYEPVFGIYTSYEEAYDCIKHSYDSLLEYLYKIDTRESVRSDIENELIVLGKDYVYAYDWGEGTLEMNITKIEFDLAQNPSLTKKWVLHGVYDYDIVCKVFDNYKDAYKDMYDDYKNEIFGLSPEELEIIEKMDSISFDDYSFYASYHSSIDLKISEVNAFYH